MYSSHQMDVEWGVKLEPLPLPTNQLEIPPVVPEAHAVKSKDDVGETSGALHHQKRRWSEQAKADLTTFILITDPTVLDPT